MFAELIQAIGDLKEQSLKADAQEFDRMKDRMVLTRDGLYTTVLADFPNRNHGAGDLSVIQKLVEVALGLGENLPATATAGIEVWYNRSGVTVIFDGLGYRRNRASMPLDVSEEIRRLLAIAGKPMTGSCGTRPRNPRKRSSSCEVSTLASAEAYKREIDA